MRNIPKVLKDYSAFYVNRDFGGTLEIGRAVSKLLQLSNKEIVAVEMERRDWICN